MPFDCYFGDEVNTIDYLEQMLADPSDGIEEIRQKRDKLYRIAFFLDR